MSDESGPGTGRPSDGGPTGEQESRARMGTVGSFIRNPEPDEKEASAALRLIFLGMWLGQLGIALLLALLLLLLSGGSVGEPSLLGPVLAVLSLFHLLLGTVVPGLLAGAGGKERLIMVTLLAAVLLAVPGWFLAFALVTGQAFLPTLVIAAATASAYAVGIVLTGRFARSIAGPADAEPADGEHPPEQLP